MNLTDFALCWMPQPGPQSDFYDCPVDEILFGGARGGGKSEGLLGRFAGRAFKYGRNGIGIMFRRSMVQLEESIERSIAIYTPMGAKYNSQKKEWKFPTGARFKFRYLDRDSDADNYQGHSYTDVDIDEAGNFPSPTPIFKLMGTLRTTAPGVLCQMCLTANPGGVGHQWIRSRYIVPNRLGYQLIRDEDLDMTRIYIPSKLQDNPLLVQNDPRYVSRLKMVGSEMLVRAWLEGDWDVVAGAYFDTWHDRMIVPDFEPPKHWTRFMAMDWGSYRPSAIGWFCVSDGTPVKTTRGEYWFPRGAIIMYREWYTWNGQPNEGKKLDIEEIAEGIMERDAHERELIRYRVADPSMWHVKGGPSMAETIARHRSPKHEGYEGVMMRPADNERIAGWTQMRYRMRGNTGAPMLYFTASCEHAIRTIPYLQHDEHKPEDVDTEGEDHSADMVRYACMSRPMVLDVPTKRKPSEGMPAYMSYDFIIMEHDQ